MAPADLEEAWNTRFKADFGYKVDRPANGVLQDVHWSVGLFGYFPTYALGNIYAGLSGQGDAHCAARLPSVATITHACDGAAPDETALLDGLDSKFTEVYAL